ncbi:hypothetical protein [Streptomyces sp. 135]|uniref:hypothetical protein n=1 Tax=Streptomyces sp. 135 TaxID=2838850 RepID=UPI001CBB07CE|nr:hypothetical protein [Streptomyces sp. 135]
MNTAAQAKAPTEKQPSGAAAISVPVVQENADDITETAAGQNELAEFANQNLDEISETTPGALKAKRSTARASDLPSDYKVLEVDMSKVASQLDLPASACKDQDSEVLVAPESITSLTYTINDEETGIPLEPGQAPEEPDGCNLSVEWEEAPAADDATQDDPEEASASVRPYAKKIASDCFRRKIVKKRFDGTTYKIAYNDSCYQNWVEKHDGNDSWNFYSKRAMSTCDRYGNWAIKSCGHGVKSNPNGPHVSWQDWAPNASQDRNDCRARSASVTLHSVSVSANFDICDKQLIHKYAEAGKMSSYWKGTARSARGTQHQVAVKTNQRQGRPKWKHWTNVGWGV